MDGLLVTGLTVVVAGVSAGIGYLWGSHVAAKEMVEKFEREWPEEAHEHPGIIKPENLTVRNPEEWDGK